MDEVIQKTVEGIVARLAGPMSFRFMLQPTIAVLLGIRDGRLDAKALTPPFIFDLVFKPADREKAIKSGLRTLLTPMIVGTVLDAVAQYLIFGRVRILPAMLVGMFVMGFPYSLARGISNRIATAMQHEAPSS